MNKGLLSVDEALARFKEKFKNNQDIMESLRVLDQNPLEASLHIKAKSADQFPAIVSFLEGMKYKDLISKVDYYENKETIKQLTAVVSAIRKVGFTLSLALALIAILISFNTIRVTIYTLRDEIGVMKLVGASNWFVRGPFIAEGGLGGGDAGALLRHRAAGRGLALGRVGQGRLGGVQGRLGLLQLLAIGAVVDLGQQLALLNGLEVLDRDLDHIAADLGADDRHLAAHIGVVGPLHMAGEGRQLPGVQHQAHGEDRDHRGDYGP